MNLEPVITTTTVRGNFNQGGKREHSLVLRREEESEKVEEYRRGLAKIDPPAPGGLALCRIWPSPLAANSPVDR
jgi:hypothetical protein